MAKRRFPLIIFSILLLSGFAGAQNDDMQKKERMLKTIIKDKSPRLYELEMRLRDIRFEVEKIVESSRKNDLQRDEAEQKIRSLLREEYVIKNSLDYYVEQSLYVIFDVPKTKE